jgi:hypothetical protein
MSDEEERLASILAQELLFEAQSKRLIDKENCQADLSHIRDKEHIFQIAERKLASIGFALVPIADGGRLSTGCFVARGVFQPDGEHSKEELRDIGLHCCALTVVFMWCNDHRQEDDERLQSVEWNTASTMISQFLGPHVDEEVIDATFHRLIRNGFLPDPQISYPGNPSESRNIATSIILIGDSVATTRSSRVATTRYIMVVMYTRGTTFPRSQRSTPKLIENFDLIAGVTVMVVIPVTERSHNFPGHSRDDTVFY